MNSKPYISNKFTSVVILLILIFICKESSADNWLKAYHSFGSKTKGSSVVTLPDGNIVVASRTANDETALMITSSNGVILKEAEFIKTKTINNIVYTSDNNLFVCGVSDSINNYGTNVFWMKLDLNLNVIWSKQSDRTFNDMCESGIQHSDGTYYIVGYGSRTGNNLSDRDALIYHIGSDGELLQARISSSFGADYLNNIIELPDNNIVAIGSKIWQVEMDVLISKFDKDLNNILTKTYGGQDSEGAYDLVTDNSNIYVLGGTHTYGAGRYDILLSKLDFNLNFVFTKSYGTVADESAYSISKINNELYLVANYDTLIVADSTYVPTKLLFVKTDLDGNILSSVYFNKSSQINNLNSVVVSSNNELIINFNTSELAKDNKPALVILVTDSLKLTCCDFFSPILLESDDASILFRNNNIAYNPAGNSLALNSASGDISFTEVFRCSNARDTTQIENINNSTFCRNQPILFNANTSIDPIRSTWIFGDSIGVIDTAGNDVIFKFDTVGVFNIYYIAEFKCNSDTDTISIEIVNSKPYFVQLDKIGNCLNKPVEFGVISSTETIKKYSWNFNDPLSTKDTSSNAFPSYTYTKPGTYKVYLFSETYCGSKLDSIDVFIPDKSKVELDKTVRTYCKNTVVPFNLNLSEIPVSTSWNFGDPSSPNNTTTGNTASHTYTKGGNFICTVISQFSCASDTDTIHLNILEYYPSPVQINYTGLCANQPFQFDVSNNLTGPTYEWEIVKNSTITNYTTKSFTHQFNSEGEYIIRVKVSDNDCNAGLDTIVLNVAEFSTAEINTITDPCLKNIVFNSINTSSNVLWKLSDGFESNENILVYSFQNTGDYEVTLITNPNSNCADTTSTTVNYIKENANGGVYIPAVFSPNGDGNNDEFVILNSTNNPCKLISFKVYDRWGKIMHSVDKYEDFKWDGKFNGNTVMPGTYVGFLETESGTSSFVINVVY